MNNLLKVKLGVLSRNTSLVNTFVRNAGAWNRDWKPGPYPETQEEREAAAKKYGLHIKDYKPYPDDGLGWGDYPMFDPISVESRDPFEDYDYPEYRRNFGELVHPDFDMYIAERHDVSKREQQTYLQQLAFFVGMVTFLYVALKIGDKFKFIRPRMLPETQMPHPSKKRYTFEKDE